MATRRGFLALLGVGSVSAPLAAKAAAEAEAVKLAGLMSSLTPANAAQMNPGSSPGQTSDGLRWLPWEERLGGVANRVRLFGLPGFLEEEFRDRAKSITVLDPDIACKRSWSLAAKIHEQRERNYKRLIDDLEVRPRWYAKRSALQKLLGFELPW